MNKKKNYPCANCEGSGKVKVTTKIKVDCGYCHGAGNLPDQWWYESVMRRCGKSPVDSVQLTMELSDVQS